MMNTMNLPASYAELNEEEMTYTTGGGAVETVIGGVAAIGAAVALTYVGGSLIGAAGGLFGDSVIGTILSTASGILTAPGALVGSIVGAVL